MRRRIVASGLRTVARHRVRSVLMMLGVGVGITALTLILTIADGTEQKVMAEIEKMFTANNIMVRSGSEAMRAHGRSEARPTTLKPSDLEAIVDEIDAVDRWDALQMIEDQEVTYRGTTEYVRVFGHTPSAELLSGRSVVEGEYFDETAMEDAERVALIGTIAAESLFGDADPIGEQIRVAGLPFEIVGVLEPRGTDLHGMNRDDELIVPLSTMMRRLQNVDYVPFGRVHVSDPDQIDAVAARMTEILRDRHAIRPNEADDFALITPVQVRRMVAQSNRVFNLVLPLVAGVALLVAAVVIANLTLVSVAERRAEIGLRKAVGATGRDVVTQLVAETVAVTMMGGVIGVGLGLWGAQLLGTRLELPPHVSWPAIVLGVVASMVVGLAAAVLPARRAAAVDPIVALR